MIKKGENLLVGNFIYIVLYLIFILILLFFVTTKSDSASVLEEGYAKQIALMLDAVQPNSVIYFNVEELIAKADENKKNDFIQIEGNLVTVQLKGNSGYSYSFFNNNIGIVNYYLSKEKGHENDYLFIIGENKVVKENE